MEDNSLCAPPLNAHARKPGVVVCMRNKSETQEELQWIAAHTPLLSLTIPGHSKVVYNRFIISSSQTPMDLPFQSRSAIQPYFQAIWFQIMLPCNIHVLGLNSSIAYGRYLALNQANLQEYPKGASNIQTYVSSRNSAIHNAYCIVLHYSSCIELKHSLQNLIIVHKHSTTQFTKLVYAMHNECLQNKSHSPGHMEYYCNASLHRPQYH